MWSAAHNLQPQLEAVRRSQALGGTPTCTAQLDHCHCARWCCMDADALKRVEGTGRGPHDAPEGVPTVALPRSMPALANELHGLGGDCGNLPPSRSEHRRFRASIYFGCVRGLSSRLSLQRPVHIHPTTVQTGALRCSKGQADAAYDSVSVCVCVCERRAIGGECIVGVVFIACRGTAQRATDPRSVVCSRNPTEALTLAHNTVRFASNNAAHGKDYPHSGLRGRFPIPLCRPHVGHLES